MPDLVMHMPCGCPYPKLGDRRPCEHGYPGSDEAEASTGPRLWKHAAHDPSWICRPAFGRGLCEVLQVKDSSEEDERDAP